jgi:hypothetical protein
MLVNFSKKLNLSEYIIEFVYILFLHYFNENLRTAAIQSDISRQASIYQYQSLHKLASETT